MLKHEPSVSSSLQEEIYNHIPNQTNIEQIRISKLRTLIATIAGIRGKRILELGCGEGLLLEPFVKNNECYGVDISSEQLKKAAAKSYKTHQQSLEMEKLPFTDEYMDIIIFSEVIEHIINTEHFINEVNRVLRKKGIVIISFPNINQPISWLMTILLDLPAMYSARIYSPHVRDFTVKLIKKLLKIKGFNVLHVEGTYVYPFKNRFSQFIARKIPRLGEKIILIAEKEHAPIQLPPVIWDISNL